MPTENQAPRYTAAIIDDEPYAIEALRMLVAYACPQLHIVATAGSFAQACELLRAQPPDLVFLDIKLDRHTGFDVLDACPGTRSAIIFITSFHDYAVRAFQYAAADYLLKPVAPDDLTRAVNRVTERLATTHKTSDNNQLTDLVRNLMQTMATTPHTGRLNLFLPDGSGWFSIETARLMMVRGQGSYTGFVLCGEESAGGQTPETERLASRNIGYFDYLCDEYPDLMRVQKSYIVNLRFVRKVTRGRTWHIEMTNGALVSVSDKHRDELVRRLALGDRDADG